MIYHQIPFGAQREMSKTSGMDLCVNSIIIDNECNDFINDDKKYKSFITMVVIRIMNVIQVEGMCLVIYTI